MSTSKLQEYTKISLAKAFPDYEIFENSRPYWLLSSDKLTKMELDLLIPTLNLAFEVQGAQHFEYIQHFHGNQEGFQRRLMLDQEKKDLCYGKGIELIEICCEMDIDLFIKDYQEKGEIKPKEKIIYLNKNVEVVYRDRVQYEEKTVTVYEPRPPKERLVKRITDVTTDEILPDVLCNYRKVKNVVEKVLEIQRYQRYYKRCCKEGKNNLGKFEFKHLTIRERKKIISKIEEAWVNGGGLKN